MQTLINEVLGFVTEDFFTLNEIEEINETIGWMADLPSEWQDCFNSLTVLYNTVKTITLQIEQAGGNCAPLLQKCAEQLCTALPQLALFKSQPVQNIPLTPLALQVQQYNLQQLIDSMWNKTTYCQSTDERLINRLIEVYKIKLMAATKLLSTKGIWYVAYWLPLLHYLTRPVDGGWKLSGVSHRLYQSLKDSLSIYPDDRVNPTVCHVLEMLTWLPTKVDVAVDFSPSRDLTLYWTQYSDNETCWDQELSGYIHGEEPFNESWSNITNIDEVEVLAKINLEV
uniref:Uncharacterized protein n=1 Tax=Siphoviridae sp. ctn8e14 TaxID=2827936 RepID=A0A8S5T4Y5_9CAUD|nr:MAG TPA: hypothetical protein [Siphoviridae sp. ctn8e14]